MKKLWEEFQYFFQQKIYVIILCLTAICGCFAVFGGWTGSRNGKMVHLSDK